MNQQLAVCVYGTLRHNESNYRAILEGNTIAEYPAVVDGFVLYGRGVPFAVPREGGQIVGELMVIAPERYDRVLARLDGLEGFNAKNPEGSLYRRVTRQVRIKTGDGVWESRDAYLYQAGSMLRLNGGEDQEIPGGDWVAFRRSA